MKVATPASVSLVFNPTRFVQHINRAASAEEEALELRLETAYVRRSMDDGHILLATERYALLQQHEMSFLHGGDSTERVGTLVFTADADLAEPECANEALTVVFNRPLKLVQGVLPRSTLQMRAALEEGFPGSFSRKDYRRWNFLSVPSNYRALIPSAWFFNSNYASIVRLPQE